MDTAHTSNEKIAEALALLEAAAREKKEELKHAIGDKYAHLKNALAGAEHTVVDTLSAAQKRAVEAIVHAKEVSQERIKKTATAVDEQVHDNPWPYIGGAAVTAFLLGFIIGRKK
jgi:ElaB/YqjD/DUF883 family membrane-anchored ribosome-binding protein